MTRSTVSSQRAKYETFRRAYDTVKTYKVQANYLAAYVITFSIIEDRLRALYVVWYRSKKNAEPSPKQINQPFTRLVNTLVADQTITAELNDELNNEAKQRNELLHAAMWNMDTFSNDIVEKAMKTARNINNAGRRAAIQLKKQELNQQGS
jgi:hypothetical protein